MCICTPFTTSSSRPSKTYSLALTFNSINIWGAGRSGESTRLPPMWPGLDSPIWRHMWVEFIVGSRPCSDGFYPGSPVFRPPQNRHFQIPIRPGTHGHLNLNEILVLFGASWVNKLRLHFLHLQILALLEEVVI